MPLLPSRNSAILAVCGLLLAPAACAQVTAPGSNSPSSASSPGAPSSAPTAGGGAVATPGSPQGSPMQGASSSRGASPSSAPTAPPTSSSSSPSMTTPPTTGALSGSMPGMVPVSPPVPILASPLPGLTYAPLPPPGQTTLPAVPPASLAPLTPGAVPLLLNADTVAALAAQRNLGLLAAFQDAFAAEGGVHSARALSPPLFTIGPALEMGGTTDGLLFLQPLEINGVRGARTRVARAQLHRAQAQAILELQALVYTSRLYFYALAQAQATLALQRSLLASTLQFNQIAYTQVRLGARPPIEAVQTSLESARARQLVAQAVGEEQAARAALNAYLGRAPLDPIDTNRALETAAAMPSSTPIIPLIADAEQLALDGRAEIAVARAERDVPVAQASLYRAQLRPDVSPSFRISQITPKYMDAGLGVVITVPIDYGTRRGLIHQSERQAQAQTDRLAGAEAQARLDAEQAVVRLNSAEAVLAEYDTGLLTDARTVRDSALSGFRVGGTTVLAVLEAERVYRQILYEQLNAQAAVAQAHAALDRAVGSVPQVLIMQLNQTLQPNSSNKPHP